MGKQRKPPERTRGFRTARGAVVNSCSDGADAGGLGTLGALADLELDALVLLKGAEAASLDLRVVDEHVGRTVFGGDEAESLFRVEPLHSSLWHFLMFPLLLGCGAPPFGAPGPFRPLYL